MNIPLITDIQKYSIHDGEGIRTTVFFKGCPLSCSWCHNPETQSYSRQLLFQAERCTGCQSCVKACPTGAVSIENGIAVTEEKLCLSCGICTDCCLQNIRNISGRHYTTDELVHEIEKDKAFYEQSNGGVTFSGGEVLSQDMDYLEELLERLFRRGFRINVDTCGHVSYDSIKRVLPYVNTFLYDMKIMDAGLHKTHTGADNALILDNLKRLSREDATLWIRIPVIGGVNDTMGNMEQTAEFLKGEDIPAEQINLLPYHSTGSGKYRRLSRGYRGEVFYAPSAEQLEGFAAVFKEYGFERIKTGG
ncbi:glycyl-radical enzyme activating protein [Lachnospiraceae bacterium 54-53]